MLSSADTERASQPEQLDLVFRALADRTRRELISRLADGSAMVTELARHFDMSLPGVGKHLRVLEKAGILQRTTSGRVHRCSLNPLPLRDADQWLAHYQKFWEETFDALIDHIRNDKDQE